MMGVELGIKNDTYPKIYPLHYKVKSVYILTL